MFGPNEIHKARYRMTLLEPRVTTRWASGTLFSTTVRRYSRGAESAYICASRASRVRRESDRQRAQPKGENLYRTVALAANISPSAATRRERCDRRDSRAAMRVTSRLRCDHKSRLQSRFAVGVESLFRESDRALEVDSLRAFICALESSSRESLRS